MQIGHTHSVKPSIYLIGIILTLLVAICLQLTSLASANTPVDSEWVYRGSDGRLEYKTDDRGNHIMDFSHAGYRGGGVALPDIDAKITLDPVPGNDGETYTDDSARIQAAIDSVAQMPLDADGFRGAVLLKAGVYRLDSTINLIESGVVLRGEGPDLGGTVLQIEGTSRTVFNLIAPDNGLTSVAELDISDVFVPSGSLVVPVDSTAGVSVGSYVWVNRPITPAYIEFMDMHELYDPDANGGVGREETWLSPDAVFNTSRYVVEVRDNEIVLDAPLSDYIDPVFNPGATVTVWESDTRVNNVGLEGLYVVGLDTENKDDHLRKIEINHMRDVWLKDIHFQTVNKGIKVDRYAQRITLDNVDVFQTFNGITSGAKPNNAQVSGTQVLFMRSTLIVPGSFPYITGSRVAGPNVLFDVVTETIVPEKPEGNNIEGHQRWATGLLLDNVEAAKILFGDRGTSGSGHGWSMGWGVVWNTNAETFFKMHKPQGANNWCIGCTGPRDPSSNGDVNPREEGTFDAYQQVVNPNSLYLAQLEDRLGPEAVVAIGYEPAEPIGTITELAVSSVIASDQQDANPAGNTLDNNLGTRWSAKGSGQWIQYTLAEPATISSVNLAWFKGDARSASFDIQISEDGANWTTVLANASSSGTTLDLEAHEFTPTNGQYVRLIGYGNTSNTWNSITETEIYGSVEGSMPPPPQECTNTALSIVGVTASGEKSNRPATNSIDGNLGSRWAIKASEAWIQWELAEEATLSSVNVAWFKGDERQSYFSVLVSTDGTNWTTVLSNVSSSGTTLDLEANTFAAIEGKYVRVVGYGNSSSTASNVISIPEVEVIGCQ